MTIDEAIKGYRSKEAEYKELASMYKEYEEFEMLREDNCQLAEWLTELKELEAKHWGECRQIAHYDDELKEAKRLLRLAVEDITFILSYACSDEEMCCEECPTVNHACNKWRYADEALKLIGGSENG